MHADGGEPAGHGIEVGFGGENSGGSKRLDGKGPETPGSAFKLFLGGGGGGGEEHGGNGGTGQMRLSAAGGPGSGGPSDGRGSGDPVSTVTFPVRVILGQQRYGVIDRSSDLLFAELGVFLWEI